MCYNETSRPLMAMMQGEINSCVCSARNLLAHAPTGLGAQEVDGVSRVNTELEKQYEAGLQIKHEGKKKGLGN